MGIKLLWTGLTFLEASKFLTIYVPAVQVVGAVFMVFGLVALWVAKD